MRFSPPATGERGGRRRRAARGDCRGADTKPAGAPDAGAVVLLLPILPLLHSVGSPPSCLDGGLACARGTCAGLRAKIRTDLPQNAGTTLVFAKTNPIEWDSGRPNRYGGRVPAVSTAPTCPTAAAKTRPTPSTPPTHAIFSVLTALKRCPNSTEEMS